MIVGYWSGLYCTCGVLIRRPVLVEVFNLIRIFHACPADTPDAKDSFTRSMINTWSRGPPFSPWGCAFSAIYRTKITPDQYNITAALSAIMTYTHHVPQEPFTIRKLLPSDLRYYGVPYYTIYT
jgi:hypothetical protein